MRQYAVEIKISGTYIETIEASDREEAFGKMQDIIASHNFDDDILKNVKEEIVLVHSISQLKASDYIAHKNPLNGE